ncbi:MAG: DUF2231 domain-containing protein [Thermodesulfobacteriota bacterium]
MGKFEVCIRGKNFLIKTGKKVRKRNFYAARFVEARDMSGAVQSAVDLLRTELKDSVANSKSDPPSVDVVDVSEVYYFQDNMVVESMDNMVLPGKGFLWDEDQAAAISNPINPLDGKLPTLMERIRKNEIHIHSIFIHFTNALYPVAILFMFLFLFFGNDAFRKTYFYIMVIATCSVPVSYLTGILQWRRKFQGVMIKIFYAKIRFGVVIFIIGLACTLWYYFSPAVLENRNIMTALFVLLNISIVPPIIYMGHLGGIIVYEGLD